MDSQAQELKILLAVTPEDGGCNSADIVAQLSAAHCEGNIPAGLDMKDDAIGDIASLGITDSVQVKWQVHLHSGEAAEVILYADDIIKAAPRKGVSLTPLVRHCCMLLCSGSVYSNIF